MYVLLYIIPLLRCKTIFTFSWLCKEIIHVLLFRKMCAKIENEEVFKIQNHSLVLIIKIGCSEQACISLNCLPESACGWSVFNSYAIYTNFVEKRRIRRKIWNMHLYALYPQICIYMHLYAFMHLSEAWSSHNESVTVAALQSSINLD